MFWVYIIRSATTNKYYIGQTEDIDKRLKQHNSRNFSKHSFTNLNGRDWKLEYKEEFKTRDEAINREKLLKGHKGRDWIKKNIFGSVAQR